jgi:hypothetical protein
MCSGMGDRTCLLPGFPIRTSPDQSSVDSSPGLFAASHVLLRLLVPRHPPCALTNLATKMLASTVQFSSYGRARSHTGAACAHQVRRSARDRSVARQSPPDPRVSEAGRARSVRRSNRSFRTQQRAWADPIRDFRSHLDEAVLGKPCDRSGLLVSVPLHERISGHSPEHASGQTERALPARCSLERR